MPGNSDSIVFIKILAALLVTDLHHATFAQQFSPVAQADAKLAAISIRTTGRNLLNNNELAHNHLHHRHHHHHQQQQQQASNSAPSITSIVPAIVTDLRPRANADDVNRHNSNQHNNLSKLSSHHNHQHHQNHQHHNQHHQQQQVNRNSNNGHSIEHVGDNEHSDIYNGKQFNVSSTQESSDLSSSSAMNQESTNTAISAQDNKNEYVLSNNGEDSANFFNICASVPSSVAQQMKICRAQPNAIIAVGLGAHKGISECQYQFKSERWNCSHPLGDHTLITGHPAHSVGNRESAFIHAIVSAGIVHSIAMACSIGNMSDCSCDRTRQGQTVQGRDKWRWGGCSDNIRHGMLYARHFVDALEKMHEYQQRLHSLSQVQSSPPLTDANTGLPVESVVVAVTPAAAPTAELMDTPRAADHLAKSRARGSVASSRPPYQMVGDTNSPNSLFALPPLVQHASVHSRISASISSSSPFPPQDQAAHSRKSGSTDGQWSELSATTAIPITSSSSATVASTTTTTAAPTTSATITKTTTTTAATIIKEAPPTGSGKSNNFIVVSDRIRMKRRASHSGVAEHVEYTTTTNGGAQQHQRSTAEAIALNVATSFNGGANSGDPCIGGLSARPYIKVANLQQDIRLAMNLHNNKAGRLALAHNMKRKCRCHGVSGSCALRTCWRTLPDFSAVGEYLKRKYETSIHIPLSQSLVIDKNHKIMIMDVPATLAVIPHPTPVVGPTISTAAVPSPASQINLSSSTSSSPSSPSSSSATVHTTVTTIPVASRQVRASTNSNTERSDNAPVVADVVANCSAPVRQRLDNELMHAAQYLARSRHLPASTSTSSSTSNRRRVNRDDLIHVHKSPDYCWPDWSRGVYGTQGRQCNATSSTAPDSCDKLCCGRGYQQHVHRRSVKCNCRFHYCCSISCYTCEQEVKLYTCK